MCHSILDPQEPVNDSAESDVRNTETEVEEQAAADVHRAAAWMQHTPITDLQHWLDLNA